MHTGRPINSALAILAKSIFWTQLHSLLSFDALFGLFLWSCARILSLMAACMLFNERSSCRNYRSVELGAGRPTSKPNPSSSSSTLFHCGVLVSLAYTVYSALGSAPVWWQKNNIHVADKLPLPSLPVVSHPLSPVFTPLRVQHDPCFRLMAASTIASQLATTYHFSFYSLLRHSKFHVDVQYIYAVTQTEHARYYPEDWWFWWVV
jgi:hypothetical protein